MESACAVPGCDKAIKCRGWCSAHYERWRKYGSPLIVMDPVPPPIRKLYDTCTINGCGKPHVAKGLCSAHYAKLLKYGNPNVDNRRTINTCSVADCDENAHGNGLCRKHWDRWRKHGDPAYEATKHTECMVDGCVLLPRSARSGLCEKHYIRRYRHGDPLMVINTRRPDALYRSAHARIQRDRGRAATYSCVDCGLHADHWSYTHADPNELASKGGQPYSLDPNYYEPRCAPCHAIYDGTGRNQYSA